MRLSFNQSESLSGIETSQLANWQRKPTPVSTNLNPYQGLKHDDTVFSETSKSFNQSESLSGIETKSSLTLRTYQMFQPIWIPIRDWNYSLPSKPEKQTGFNQSESLSGIETSSK